MSLNFILTTIAIKMRQNGQVVQQEVEAMMAESVGLAYHPTDAGQEAAYSITITHIASQVLHLAMIGALHEVAEEEQGV